MVKSYLRYEERACFGVVVSAEANNICYDATGRLLLSGALEQLLVWNAKQARCVQTLAPSALASASKPALTAISISPSSPSLAAVGYGDGSLRVWDFVKGQCEATLNGHKGAVAAVRYNKAGSLLATGSKDTDIILWDAVAETGLFRLKGHRDQVTDLIFIDKGRRLVSCSKDNYIRVWDLETQSCSQIVVNHRSEVWSLDVDPKERFLVSGGADLELRLYEILDADAEKDGAADAGKDERHRWDALRHVGDVKRQSTDRVVGLRFNEQGSLLGCHAAGKSLELYSLKDDAEALRKSKRRKRRKREKAEKAGTAANTAEDDILEAPQASDYLQLLQIVRLKQKVRAFSFSPLHFKKDILCNIAFSMHNNSIEVYEVGSETASRIHSIDLPGHRSDIRSAVLSKDDTLLMTTSHNAVKIWNPATTSCLRTMEAGYGLCGVFAPGNHHCIVGTKAGTLEIFDIRAGERSKVVEAHSGAVWSIAAMPDGTGLVTGSADHDVKFWEYELIQEADKAAKQLTVRNTSTIKMTEDVLCVCLSLDAKYLAVALLDSTVQVFFRDSKKFYLSLYGHKLPVLCMDISSDGSLIATGSADKNIKIWGMDFGDCHKSLFAHGDSVMSLKFVPKTHYIFSVGKDRLVKYWDADKFEHLLTLEGHHAEVWCLAISSHGDFVMTGSHDRSLRRWERTDEPFFIEEEREKRLETMLEAELEDTHVTKDELPEEGAAGLAGRRTQETVTAADSIIDALDVAEDELKRIEEHKASGGQGKLTPNIFLRGLSPAMYVCRAISVVRPSDLEQALLMLPFSDALKLLEHVKEWNSEGNQVELACRVVTMLLRMHHEQLVATASARQILTTLHSMLHSGVEHLKDIYGFNLAAMGHLQLLMAMNSNPMFKDAGSKLTEVKRRLASKKHGLEEGRRRGEKRKQTQPQK